MTELAYLTATELVKRIKAREISSAETLEYFIERMVQRNPKLNAIIATNVEAARARAISADTALDNGEDWGPLHGLPMTIKDSFEVVGMATTSGAPELRNHRPQTNADTVQKLVDAGAIIFGKTNLPLYAGDMQSYNKLFGTTNNPWDVSRTPGGSSGGAAAALAAGMTPLELGSDIGGSIRTPAHYCGVYGHKPTQDIVSLRGHIPGPPGSLTNPDLAVAGPMSRSAEDLKLQLDIMAGPRQLQSTAWRLKLPAARHRSLKKFRVAAWFDSPYCTIDFGMRAQYEKVIVSLREAGVEVVMGAPAGLNLYEIHDVYIKLLGATMGSGLPPKVYRKVGVLGSLAKVGGKYMKMPEPIPTYLQAITQSFQSWAGANEKRLQLQKRLVSYFEDVDVLLMPVSPVTAYLHVQEGEIVQRQLEINGQQRLYIDQLVWIGLATAFGLPATSAPVGMTAAGLPTNIQIVSGPYQDHTTIAFAGHLAKVMGGFMTPPGYS